MAKSDHSDGDEEVQAEMPPLQTSNDSIRSDNGKREREDSLEKEVTIPKKKIRMADNVEIEAKGKSIKPTDSQQREKANEEKTFTQDKRSPSVEEEALNKSTDKDISTAEGSVKSTSTSLNEEKEQEEEKEKKQKEEKEQTEQTEKKDKEEKENEGDKKEEKQNEISRRSIKKSNNKDTEVVEGLELSVECASDKEESSFESDEEMKKPRSRTTIVKAKPNDSELDVSSSETERSINEESTETADANKGTKGRKKGVFKTNEKSSQSELESKESEEEEDYEKPRGKQKGRGTRAKRGAKSSTELKKGHSGRKAAYKKDKDEEKVEDEDEETNNIETDKSTTESKEKSDENSSDKEMSSSDNSSDDEDGKRRKRDSKADDDKRIQALKKYIRAAGIKVKSYHEIWVGCKSNAAKARKLKSLLEEHGITGRPTLEKCKKVKERNERLKEVSELDKSNIISEGRVTRARRGMDANKNSIVTSDMSPRQREARNAYKRLRSVADSDSE